MGRGLILTLNYKNANTCGGIPDVFAVRLCQTRIFPFTDDQARDGQGQDDRISSNIDAIKRMEVKR
uniref:Uncharacterized protein n=1 Tax=Ciona savignyi TaxID=51511 RepID=H2YSQ2_CIOSA